MNTPIEKIKKLMKFLPLKDIELGNKFLYSRNFDSLKELVDSAIIRVKKQQALLTIKDDYKDINVDNIRYLKAEVDSYVEGLSLGNENSSLEEDIYYDEF